MHTLFQLSILTTLLPLIRAQSSGTIYINASDPASHSPSAGCIVLAQVASLSTPSVITRMIPVCPATAGTYASEPATGMSLPWPVTNGGDGASSSMAVYAQVTPNGGVATAGCVMGLSQMQSMYLLGRTLDWNNGQSQMWDYNAQGWLRDPTTFNVITW